MIYYDIDKTNLLTRHPLSSSQCRSDLTDGYTCIPCIQLPEDAPKLLNSPGIIVSLS